MYCRCIAGLYAPVLMSGRGCAGQPARRGGPAPTRPVDRTEPGTRRWCRSRRTGLHPVSENERSRWNEPSMAGGPMDEEQGKGAGAARGEGSREIGRRALSACRRRASWLCRASGAVSAARAARSRPGLRPGPRAGLRPGPRPPDRRVFLCRLPFPLRCKAAHRRRGPSRSPRRSLRARWRPAGSPRRVAVCRIGSGAGTTPAWEIRHREGQLARAPDTVATRYSDGFWWAA